MWINIVSSLSGSRQYSQALFSNPSLLYPTIAQNMDDQPLTAKFALTIFYPLHFSILPPTHLKFPNNRVISLQQVGTCYIQVPHINWIILYSYIACSYCQKYQGINYHSLSIARLCLSLILLLCPTLTRMPYLLWHFFSSLRQH